MEQNRGRVCARRRRHGREMLFENYDGDCPGIALSVSPIRMMAGSREECTTFLMAQFTRLYRPEKTLGTDILGDRDRGGLPYRKIYLRSWSVGPRSRIVRKSTRNGSRNMETEVRFALGIDSPDPSLGEGWARAMLYLGTSLFWYGESGAHFEWTWIHFLNGFLALGPRSVSKKDGR